MDCFPYINFPLLKSLTNIFDFFRGCPNVEDVEVTSLSIVNSHIPEPPEEGAEALPKLVRAKISQFYRLLPLLCNAQFLYATMVSNASLISIITCFLFI
jgi:hypothetical protein